jgi:S1-C subfamily serine protease
MFAAIFALSVAFGQSPALSSSTPTSSIAAQVTVSPIPEGKDDPLLGQVNLPALVKIVRQSVVQIFGYRSGKIVQTGSGFIAEDGAVVTNFHVIKGIDDAYIKLSNGARKHVLGLAHYSDGADIAVLLVPNDKIRGLSLAPSLPEVGERIYVIGNPGIFAGTLSDGLVSALRDDGYGAVVQITAPISHGSSGSSGV